MLTMLAVYILLTLTLVCFTLRAFGWMERFALIAVSLLAGKYLL